MCVYRGGSNLDCAVIQALGVLVKLHPHGEVHLIVPEGALGHGLKDVSFLGYDLGLHQVRSDLPGGEVDV